MRFHELFRELMEAELAHLDPARRLELHRRAAELAEERGDLPAARRHLAAVAALPATRGAAPRAVVELTQRELSIVALLPTHLSNAEIGARLSLSVNTVKSNLKANYRKLDATTRTEAVDAATAAGLL